MQRTLNTGIVTLLNYGRRVPTGVTTITFAHEAGHNFGSEVSGLVCGSVMHSGTFECLYGSLMRSKMLAEKVN